MNQRVVWKWFWAWDFEKEEQWLNEMALAGWVLVNVRWCRYTFEAAEPGAWIIRLEMHEDDPAYLSLLSEMGAQFICRWFQWIYLRRPAEYGSFDLFSDLDSRIAHLNRISRVLSALCIMNLGIGVMNVAIRNGFGMINLLLGALIAYGLGRIHGKREELQKERRLRE